VGGGGTVELDAQQVQQGHVKLVRHHGEALDRQPGHPREQLDEGGGGIGAPVDGQLRAQDRHASPRLGDELRVAPVVEPDRGEAHPNSSAGIT
jgi:hypothetical protein